MPPERSESVSYTHLDVYKRQVEGPASDLRIAGWVYIEALAPGPGISLQLQQRLHCLVISLHSKATHQVGGRAGPLNYQFTCLRETFFGAIEFGSVMLAKTREALIEKHDSLIKVRIEALKDTYEDVYKRQV